MKSTESAKGIPRKVLTTVLAGVLPTYVVSFPLEQETISMNKREKIIFIVMNLYKIHPLKDTPKLFTPAVLFS